MPGKLAAIGIVTRDMRESVRFYRELGVDVADPEEDADHHDAELPSGVRLMWDTVELIKKLDPEWEESRGQGMALAFECESPADVDATYRRVVEAGFGGKKAPYDAFWGQRYATLADPDGNGVDLFASL
jgi:catechol 2,3-dioxygenase-like lactoylglutathione lyase family enzyme